MWDFSLSILNQSGPLGGRWKAYSIAHPTTPQWSGMVQATSRYRPGKLTLLNPKIGHFWSFLGHFWTKNNADVWDFSRSILNQSGPLGVRWKAYSLAHKTTPQWSGMVQATSRYGPGKLTLLNPKFGHFGRFGAQKNADMWDFSLSILNQSGPLGGRWKAYSIAHPTTPQWSGMVQATSRYGPGKLTLLNPKFGHFGHFGSFLGQK